MNLNQFANPEKVIVDSDPLKGAGLTERGNGGQLRKYLLLPPGVKGRQEFSAYACVDVSFVVSKGFFKGVKGKINPNRTIEIYAASPEVFEAFEAKVSQEFDGKIKLKKAPWVAKMEKLPKENVKKESK